jgi:hypothetical protein
LKMDPTKRVENKPPAGAVRSLFPEPSNAA